MNNNNITDFDIYTWFILNEPLESLYNLKIDNKFISNYNVIFDDKNFINWLIFNKFIEITDCIYYSNTG